MRRLGFVFCSGCFKGTNSLSRFRKPVFKGIWFEERIPEPAVSPADRNAGGQSENRVPQGFRAAVFPIPSKMCAVGRHYGLILKYIHKTLFLSIYYPSQKISPQNHFFIRPYTFCGYFLRTTDAQNPVTSPAAPAHLIPGLGRLFILLLENITLLPESFRKNRDIT